MSKAVHDMFQSIASRYDLANDVLSFGIHRVWREKALNLLRIAPGTTAVDLCTGTGDVAISLSKRIGAAGKVFGVDFVKEMLDIAKRKPIGPDCAPIEFIESDASSTPLPGDVADVVTVSFGIRNVDSPLAGLQEMKRILRPGGKAMVLEFGQPPNIFFRDLYEFYSFRIMPFIGGLLTKNREAYEYLPRTSKAFPSGQKFLNLMKEAGFQSPSARPVFFGIAYIYIGQK